MSSVIVPKLDKKGTLDLCNPFNKSGYFSGSSFYTKDEDLIWLRHIGSSKKNLGLATDNLRFIALKAQQEGNRFIELQSYSENVCFYEKLGFEQVENIAFKMTTLVKFRGEIANTKFADFSKFKFNQELTDISSEVLSWK